MKILISLVTLIGLAAFATNPKPPSQSIPTKIGPPFNGQLPLTRRPAADFGESTECQSLLTEVDAAAPNVRESLPELKYIQKPYLIMFTTTTLVRMMSVERRPYQLTLIWSPSSSVPGDWFILVYLRDSRGKLVDWQSRWLYNRLGILGVRLMDVNEDSLKDLCFIAVPWPPIPGQTSPPKPVQTLAAYEIRGDRFVSVGPTDATWYNVDFEKRIELNDLVLEPLLQGHQRMRSGKIYEIPLKVTYRGQDFARMDEVRDAIRSSTSEWIYFSDSMSINQKLAPFESADVTFNIRLRPYEPPVDSSIQNLILRMAESSPKPSGPLLWHAQMDR